MTVEKENPDGTWSIYRTDAHFDTLYGIMSAKHEAIVTHSIINSSFSWRRTLSSSSEVRVQWDVPPETPTDTNYRMRHFGYHKAINGSIYPYVGTSQTFNVRNPTPTPANG